MSEIKVTWDEGAYEGDTRRLARCGHIAIGAIFLQAPKAKSVRWRVWCTAKQHPIEGATNNVSDAKKTVEKKFYDFCELAGLISK